MNIEEVEELFKGLADKSRLLIVKSLLEKSQYVEELSKRLNLADSTVSFHLKKLINAGLVKKEKKQYYTMYSIKKDLFSKKLEDFMSFHNDDKNVQEKRIKSYREKIIKTFMKDGRIVQIPAQKQKRWIVFETILRDFEYGKEYSEQEVNEIIKKYHDDYCMIRRSFIEEQTMVRKNGLYRITEVVEKSRTGKPTESIKHGLKESYEQSIRDKFGVSEE